MYYHLTIHAYYSTEPDNPSISRTHSCLTWREMVCELYRHVRVTRDLFESDTGHHAIVFLHEAAHGNRIDEGQLIDQFHSWSMTDHLRADAMLNDLIAMEHDALKKAISEHN